VRERTEVLVCTNTSDGRGSSRVELGGAEIRTAFDEGNYIVIFVEFMDELGSHYQELPEPNIE